METTLLAIIAIAVLGIWLEKEENLLFNAFVIGGAALAVWLFGWVLGLGIAIVWVFSCVWVSSKV